MNRSSIVCAGRAGALIGLLALAAWVPPAAADDGLDTALKLEQVFSSVAERASKAVVVITNKQTLRYGQSLQGIPPEFRRFFGIPDEDPERPAPGARQVPRVAGKGSGVVMADGYIVTNYHVIKDHDALEVKLHDGRTFDTERDPKAVEVVGTDEETDLAVLRLGNGALSNVPGLAFADSDEVRVGQWAVAVGAPFNFDYSVTVGVVSQKGRHDVRMNTYENYIQTDASINPGNSGGPLLNLKGEVIGINDFIVTGGGGLSPGNVGLGFAIASNLAKQVVADIVAEGKVVRPWLGIAMQELDEDLKKQFKVDHGVLISDVLRGDPAEKAGLEAGDVILEVGGRAMASPHDVQFAVLKYRPGEGIPVLVDRRGERMKFTVTAKRKDGGDGLAGPVEAPDDLLTQFGLGLDEGEDGVVVAGVAPGSAAAAADLRKGDVVLEVNRRPVKTLGDVMDAMREGTGGVAVLYVQRAGRKFFVPLHERERD
ncbi:MAG: Periplasmic pH-dependent serine endoprotease DegQ precursor [Lentisphaerae bacterium ADurb.BinA184]|nr:MAG: Periplasmic pH-dependent serine endoprotease DegQ precursor [Lentisphaerae bacterium ADurb.BinA184]